jgi:hypothetical protein
VIDGDESRALWFSLAGNEQVPLDRPLTRPLEALI